MFNVITTFAYRKIKKISYFPKFLHRSNKVKKFSLCDKLFFLKKEMQEKVNQKLKTKVLLN